MTYLSQSMAINTYHALDIHLNQSGAYWQVSLDYIQCRTPSLSVRFISWRKRLSNPKQYAIAIVLVTFARQALFLVLKGKLVSVPLYSIFRRAAPEIVINWKMTSSPAWNLKSPGCLKKNVS